MEKLLPSIPAKRYFTIGEVSDLCGVKPHVLRYWEQEFVQLRPMKRRGNRRYYQHHEVLMIRRIRDLLYDQGFTISGARNQLQELGQSGSDKNPQGDILCGSTSELLAGDSAFDEFADSVGFHTDVAGQTANSPDILPQQLERLRQELYEIRDLLSFAH